ncbi:MAG TPA: hypothetical protein VLU43_15845 [Anaeromyxobacteraceae bacterium]|nr:hypothetical protein [Anaeromyxobacteraceae bacterium]
MRTLAAVAAAVSLVACSSSNNDTQNPGPVPPVALTARGNVTIAQRGQPAQPGDTLNLPGLANCWDLDDDLALA